MTVLPQTTKRRIKSIPQLPSVWEGDRRCLGSLAAHLEPDLDTDGECIIWVDGSEGSVRAMEIVPAETGIEAVVRALLRAIESPHHPAQPARPQKIVVCDREIQFFLRGALQELDITVEYAPNLPLIDQLFQSLATMGDTRPPSLPPQYQSLLTATAYQVWEEAPWEILADSDVLSVQIEDWDEEEIYICVIGLMAAEYGVLLYRSLDSLKRFRAAALGKKSVAELEQDFLAQDCWFLNFEVDSEEEDAEEEDDWSATATSKVAPLFGSLHPYEGMRPFLDQEEAKIVYVALVALLRFVRQYSQQLAAEQPKISDRYQVSLSLETTAETVTVQIATLPQLTEELMALGESFPVDTIKDEVNVAIQEDLIPDGSLITLGSIPWELKEQLQQQKRTYHQSLKISSQGEGLPIVLIQTSRPKAKAIIEKIKDSGGLKKICFNPGSDPFTEEIYDLGLFQTGNGELHIFAEYARNAAQHTQAVERWYKRCQITKGYCGLIIAMGVTGNAKGNPQPKDMLALFEAKAINSEELGMGILQLLPNLDWE